MKITAEKAIQLLNTIGLQDVELVENESEMDFKIEDALSNIDASREDVILQKHRTRLKDEITNQITGTLGDKLRRALRDTTGIEIGELKDLNDKDAIIKALQFRESKYSSDTEGLRNEITELAKKHSASIEKLKLENDENVNFWKRKYSDNFVINKIIEAIADSPIPSNSNKSVLAKLYKQYLETKANVVYDENTDKVSLLDKETGAPLLNESKTMPIGLGDYSEEFFTPLGLWAKDTRSFVPDATKGDNYNNITSITPESSTRESAINFANRMS